MLFSSRFRRLLILLLSISALSVATPSWGASVGQIKILSFNIWVQGGLSLSNCIEVIRTSGADIVGLQECNATTAQTIATNLGFYVHSGSDSSIVSRYPIITTYVAGYSRGVTVQLSPGQRVHVFDCHLTAFPYGPYDLHNGQSVSYVTNQENSVRMPDLNQLLSVMQPLVSGPEPCFLTGDFNAPSHLDYAALPWPTSVACLNAGWADSYRVLHSTNRTFPGPFSYTDPGITWTPKTNQEPDGVFDRIDFIYYSPGDGATPLNSIELDERNSINPWPSDHRAVISTFSLVPPIMQVKATIPYPANLATNIDFNATLTWLPGSNATSHAVYFGMGAPNTLLTNTADALLVMTNLSAATTYFWRVDETTPGGVVTGDVWSFTTKPVGAAVYEWKFTHGDLTPSLGNGVLAYADGAITLNLTVFGVTDGTTVPHIAGKPAKYLRAPAFTGINNGYAVTFTSSPPNGGGGYINEYTMIFDVLWPSPINWFPFFNTDPGNSNDADFYLAYDGSLGIAAIGYSATGIITTNTWYRIAFAADMAGGVVTYYLNGLPVCTGNAVVDGRHSVYSNVSPGPSLRLFNEGDTSGVYTHAVYLSSFLFADRKLSPAEIAALGSPKARGILIPAPPINLSIKLQSTNAVLQWSGGEGPFQLQRTYSLASNATWENVGAPTSGTNTTVSINTNSVFFRVAGQGP